MSSMKKLIKYVLNPKKTEDLMYCGGHNCDCQNAFEDFMSVKEEFNKTDGVQCIHFTQSFSPEDNITAQTAKEIAERFLQYSKFDGFQVLYGIHMDKNHLHTHYVINSVNMDTGLKWHMGTNEKDLQPIKDYSDKLCKEYGLKTIFEVKLNKGARTAGEYRQSGNAQSWKYELYLAVLNSMIYSSSQAEFIDIMNKLGYGVNWTADKKYVTFVTPEKMKCRNSRLYPQQMFTKEAMEKQFAENINYKSGREEFIKLIDMYRKENVSCKYPLSDIKNNNSEVVGILQEDYTLKYKTQLEQDIKFELYRNMMYSLNTSKSIEELSDKLMRKGIRANMSGDTENIDFIIGEKVISNNELYPAEKFTRTAILLRLTENQCKWELNKLFGKSMYKAKSVDEFYKLLKESGYTIKYHDENSSFAVKNNDTFICNSNEIWFAERYTKENLSDFYEEKKIMSELNKALFITSKTSFTMEEFIAQMSDKGYTVAERDGKLVYTAEDKEYSESKTYPKGAYTIKGLEMQFEFNTDKDECNKAAFRLRQVSASIEQFADGMEKLGYRTEWNEDGFMEVKTDKGQYFKYKDIYSKDLFKKESIQNQCKKVMNDIKFDMFCEIVQLLRQLNKEERQPISAMQGMEDLSGEKLREYMYHYEEGSNYNDNLRGYIRNTDMER